MIRVWWRTSKNRIKSTLHKEANTAFSWSQGLEVKFRETKKVTERVLFWDKEDEKTESYTLAEYAPGVWVRWSWEETPTLPKELPAALPEPPLSDGQ